MKGADIEFWTQLRFGALPQLQELQLPHFIRQRLSRIGDVAVHLGLQIGFRLVGVFMKEVDHLLACPMLIVNAGIDDQAAGAEKFA